MSMSEYKIDCDLKEGEIGVYMAFMKDGHLYTATDPNYTLETIDAADLSKCKYAIKEMVKNK